MIHTHNGILCGLKQKQKNKQKKEILPFVITWMNLENIRLNEISQTQKNKYCMTSLKYES